MPFTGYLVGRDTDSALPGSLEVDWVKVTNMKEVEVQKITLQSEEVVACNFQ